MPRPPLTHVVVLMMENRSFDHMLGFLNHPGQIRKVDATCWNTLDPFSNDPAARIPATSNAAFRARADPGHDHRSAMLALYGKESGWDETKTPDMNGFVANYARVVDSNHAGELMQCFSPNSVPVISTLAKEFALSDGWFSSLPGETQPNRYFAHCATSRGLVDNRVVTPPPFFGAISIFETLADEGYHSTVYSDGIPLAAFLTHLHQNDSVRFKNYRKGHSSSESFERDVAGDVLASYSFIEPRHYGAGANSQHPTQDITAGEALIRDVYETLRAHPAVFEKTLLVITWDENGGFYDHVKPPTAISPDSESRPGAQGFGFTRLGPRVPTVFISPYIPAGTVVPGNWDHSAIPRLVKEVHNLGTALTARDAAWPQADIDQLIGLRSLNAPRQMPACPPPAAVPGPADVTVLTENQAALVQLAHELERRYSPHEVRSRRLPDGSIGIHDKPLRPEIIDSSNFLFNPLGGTPPDAVIPPLGTKAPALSKQAAEAVETYLDDVAKMLQD